MAAVRDGTLVVRLAAPPHEGKANDALRAFVARLARVPRNSVSIVRGARGRDKLVRVDGVTGRELRAAIEAAASS